MMGYGFGFGWVVILLFWLFVIAAIVWLALTLTHSQRQRPDESDALHILRERLARGEIDVEEFRARRAALEESRR